jgi:hypothetical protein
MTRPRLPGRGAGVAPVLTEMVVRLDPRYDHHWVEVRGCQRELRALLAVARAAARVVADMMSDEDPHHRALMRAVRRLGACTRTRAGR